MRRKPLKVVLFGVLFLAMGLAAHAGTLRIGAATVQGDRVTIPVVLDGDVGTGVSSVDFKFTYDPAVLEPVDTAAGAAATAAGKQVQTNTLEPGQYKVVMFGLNQTTIASGEVAQITMRKIGNSGTTDVSVVEPNFADPNAVAIPSSGSSETLRLDANQEQDETTPDKQEDNSQNPQENTQDAAARNPSAPSFPQLGDGSENQATTDQATTPGRQSTSPDAARGGASSPSKSSDPTAMQRLARALEATDQARGAVPTPTSPDTPAPTDSSASETAGTLDETQGTPQQTHATLRNSTETDRAASSAAPNGAVRDQVAALDPASVTRAEESLASAAKEPPSTSKATWYWMGAVIVVIAGLFLVRRKLFS